MRDDVTICAPDGSQLHADEAPRKPADPLEGQLVGEYRIEKKIGQGGFGSVYRAVQPVIGKTVAVKVLNLQLSSNPQVVSRFVAEARAVNQIRHRNIIDIFSFGALADGRQYYVMELLEGVTLDAFIRERGRLSPEVAIPILRPLARALDAAHAAGIAHRDLKPENIFLTFDEDGGVFPKLLDFGIAKLLVSTTDGHKTRTGAPIGTPRYMSPEQCRGKNVDHRTDIYSFGIVAHEALTGRLPFESDSVMELMMQHTQEAAPAVSSICAELSRELDRPVLHMLEKDPASRPPSLTAAIEALAEAAQRAGHVVPGLASRTTGDRAGGGGEPLATRPGGGGTPAELAPTTVLPAEPGGDGTLPEVESDVVPAPRRRAALLAATAGAAVSLGIAAALLAGLGAGPAPQATAPAAAGPATPDVVAELAPARSAAERAPASPPPEAAEVEVEIQSTPKNAAVFLGAERLGEAPGPFRIRRGAGKISLTIRADGYSPREIEVTPDKDVVLSTSLTRAPAAKSRRPGPGDLEDPF